MQLQDVTPNREVTLIDDPTFRGYCVGRLTNPPAGWGETVIVAVANPGKTGITGHKPFLLANLTPAPAGRSK